MDDLLFFNPVPRGNASEDMALQIEAAILSGQIEPGQRLPSERELQVRFRTGRGVVREALRALKQKGLIEVKKGTKGGAYVKQVDVYKAGESLALLLRQQHIPTDYLVEFRESIDRTVTQLVITRANADEKKFLYDKTLQLVAMAEEPEPDLAAMMELDRELNATFVNMSKNLLFEWIVLTIQRGFGTFDNALYENPKFRHKTAINWSDTAREIMDNEPLKALSYISHHYLMLQQSLKELDSSDAAPGDESSAEPNPADDPTELTTGDGAC